MRFFQLIGIFVLLTSGAHADNDGIKPAFQNGDIIFQSSDSDFSMAIGLATGSMYTHMGLIYERNGEFYVYEAIQPVSFTTLDDWIDRGLDDHYVVQRLKNADTVLTPKALAAMYKAGEQYLGKSYDSYFEWSDQRIYCSELVWKIYDEALGIQLGELAPLKSYDLDHELVQQKLREHYGVNIPYEEMMIAPETIFRSNQLELVWME